MERAGLFLLPLDEVRGWWRYQLDHTSVKYVSVTLAEGERRISCHIFRSTHEWVSLYP